MNGCWRDTNMFCVKDKPFGGIKKHTTIVPITKRELKISQ